MKAIELWTLQIEHNYYRQKEPREIAILDSQEMKIFLMRRNMMWRRKSMSEWSLIAFENAELYNDDILELQVVATDNELPYITDLVWVVGSECYDIEVPVESKTLAVKECATHKTRTRTTNCLLKLRVPIGRMFHQRRDPITTKLTFGTVSKYWEYIFIPRQQSSTKVMRLEDTRKTVSFGEYETTEFMGHKAYRIRSLDRIPLQEHYQQIELVLWEKLLINDTVKEQTLLRNLPFPDPSMKLEATKDTAWRVLYI